VSNTAAAVHRVGVVCVKIQQSMFLMLSLYDQRTFLEVLLKKNLFFFFIFELTSALVEDHCTSQTNSHMYNFLKYSICISPE